MKPNDRRVTAASYRRYVIGYAIFIFFRCALMYRDPKPIRTSTIIAVIGFVFIVVLMLFLTYLRLEYALLALGIIAVELIARDTGIRSLFFLEAALAALLALLALRRKEVPT